MSLTIIIIIISFSLIMQAFFSGIELGIISISRIKLLHKINQGSRGAKVTKDLLSFPDKLLGTTLVGTNIAIVISSTLVTGLLYDRFPKSAEYLSLLVLTPLMLIFCEAIPKALFREYKDNITIHFAFLLKLAYFIFYPVVIIVTFISNALIKLFGGKKVKKSPFITRDELKIITLESYPGKEEEVMRKIARRIFHFGEKTAGSIMLSLNEMVMFEKTQPIKELKHIFKQVKFSKYPVYSRKPENIVGFVYIKDILAIGSNKRIAGFMREPEYVEANMGLEDILERFRKGGDQMVFVKEGDRVVGVITLEDVLEELVGDIKDEYDIK